MGDAVADRLKVLMPNTEIVELGSQRPDQSKRWKHLYQLIDRGKIIWPAHAKTRSTKVYERFIQQMSDLELEYVGPYMLAKAPNEAHAHDDFPDSLSMACILTSEDYHMKEVEQSISPFYS